MNREPSPQTQADFGRGFNRGGQERPKNNGLDDLLRDAERINEAALHNPFAALYVVENLRATQGHSGQYAALYGAIAHGLERMYEGGASAMPDPVRRAYDHCTTESAYGRKKEA